jgi:sugar/nucleoside kinase (ribokinase family)
MVDLLVIGVIDIHTVIRTSLRKGTLNEIGEFSEQFTGSALHIAINASLLGAEVGIISPVGRDAVGLLDIFRRYEIDYSHSVLSSKKNPNFIDFHASRRQYTLYYGGAREDMTSRSMDAAYLKKAKAIHICFPDVTLANTVVNLGKKGKSLTSIDTAFSNGDADILFTEKKSTQGHTIVYMNFNKGIFCNGKNIPVFTESVEDEEKMKNAFIAAFLTRYIKSENIEHAALYGSCAAYFCSQSEKKVLSCTKEELDDFFQEKVHEIF